MSCLKKFFLNLNIFESHPNSDEAEDVSQHRFNIKATRIFLVALVLLLVFFAFILWLSFKINIVIVYNPTEEQFEALPPNTQCSCSNISIQYGQFVSFQPSFHQVCSSDFVSSRWIRTIFTNLNPTSFYRKDFRIASSAQFQALASFCVLSKTSVLQSITSFNADRLISRTVLSRTLLQSQVEVSVKQFQLTAYKTFASQLQLVRQMTRVFELLSGLQISIITFHVPDLSGGDLPIRLINENIHFDNGSDCDCRQNLDCQRSLGIYNVFGNREFMDYSTIESRKQMSIPGISGGCLPVDGMLLSTLECFYNQTCVDQLVSFFSPLEKFTAMAIMKKSQFSMNTTVKSIVNRLMVEDWGTNILYHEYYYQCTPDVCTSYSITKHNDLIIVLAKIVSSLGVVIVLLKLLIPPVLRFIEKPRNSEPSSRVSRK